MSSSTRNDRVTLCMVVRDEVELLPECLQAASGSWDELVVVDTGSTDGTQAVARSFGAKVVGFEWVDDFAAARNAGLAQATGDWILFLDADEMLSPTARVDLRACSQREEVGAATLVFINPLPDGHRRESRLLRFFRADPQVRFTHRIHEDVSASVTARLARTRQQVVGLAGTVLHLGYSRARMAAKGKRARDRRLLEQALVDDPDDLYAWFKLLEQAHFWRDEALSRHAAAGAVESMSRRPTAELRALHFGGELVASLAWAEEGGAPERLAVIERWFERVRPCAQLLVARGELLEATGELPAADLSYLGALSFEGAPGDLQFATVRPLMGLARLAIARGEPKVALRRVKEALRYNIHDVEALTAAMLLGAVTGSSRLLAELAPVPERPERYLAQGEAALLQGEPDRAVAALEEGSRHTSDQRVKLRLAQALLADGRLEPARRLAQQLAPHVPEARLGLLVCDLIEGLDTDLDWPLSQREADVAMREWVKMLHVGPATSLLARLRASASAVGPLFPWLAALVGVQAVAQ